MTTKTKRPTLQDIADFLGVTKMTVSRYLRNPESVAAETRPKIAQAIEQFGYIPNKAPNMLFNARSRAIGVLVPSLTNQVFADVIKGIEQITDAAGYQTMLAHYGYSQAKEAFNTLVLNASSSKLFNIKKVIEMKNSNVVKFSLTLVCAAVLSACGSSGGGSSSAPAAQTPAATTPETTTTATTTETTNTAPTTAQTGAVEGVTTVTDATNTALSFGHKSVKKRESNLNIGAGKEESSNSSTVPTAMTIPLDPSLDTIVVATGNFQDRQQAAYLEDFDFRGNTANTTGEHTLEHIHVAADGVTAGAGVERMGGSSRTKTDKQGTESGKALVFQADRINYISTDEVELKNEKLAETKGLRDRNGSVAEVYGNKTFLAGNSAEAQPATTVANEALTNAPFLYKDADGQYTTAGQLNQVQYGRVTTKLDQNKMDNFRDGLPVVDGDKTRIASFGVYGENGTEDHYFYRSNVGSRSAVDTAALQNHYKSGTVQYNGHAVTYGLDHSFKATNGIPNALGYQKELVSGTHVQANIDLETNKVDGKLYDVWRHGAYGDVKAVSNDLVSFNGTLNAANGGITGTSSHKGTEGTFNANVFGGNAEELGGAVKSKATLANESWGAVFGAKAVQPTPVAPIVTRDPDGLMDSTDGNNATAGSR